MCCKQEYDSKKKVFTVRVIGSKGKNNKSSSMRIVLVEGARFSMVSCVHMLVFPSASCLLGCRPWPNSNNWPI